MPEITRKLDEMGRIVIPKDFLVRLGWQDGQEIEVILERETSSVLLREIRPLCVLCKVNYQYLIKLDTVHICPDCLETLADIHTPGPAQATQPQGR